MSRLFCRRKSIPAEVLKIVQKTCFTAKCVQKSLYLPFQKLSIEELWHL